MITTLPFNSGINQGVDKKLLPDGILADAVNVELPVDGRVVGRAGYTALGTTVYGSGSWVCYDLIQHNRRLLALGDRLGKGFATDIGEFTRGNGAAVWRPTDPATSVIRLPRATALRDLGVPVDQQGGVTSYDVAAAGGFVCVAYVSSSGSSAYVHVFRPDDDQTFLFESLDTTGNNPFKLVRVVALSDRFIIVGVNGANQRVGMYSFRWGTDEALQAGPTDLFNEGQPVFGLDAAVVTGTDTFVAACCDSTPNTTIRRFDASGTQLTEYGPVAAVSTTPAIEADSTQDTVTLATGTGTGVSVHSFDLTSGSEIGAGPFSATVSGDSVTAVALARIDATTVVVAATATFTADSSECQTVLEAYNPASNAFGDTYTAFDLNLTSKPIVHAGEVVFAARTGDDSDVPTPAGLYSALLGTADSLTPLAGKDLGITSGVLLPFPSIALDSSTGRYYWPNASENEDEDSIPVITEMLLGSTERRQSAQLGNTVTVSGGLPVSFAGRSLVESGFTERPRIVSITPSDGAGELLGGAEYDYRLHWEWVDEQRQLHRSPVSPISTVTMGASHDTNTIICATPHSLRNNIGAQAFGSSLRLVLHRTFSSVTLTQASITGTAQVSPPSASLDGLQIIIGTFDGVGFFQTHTVTFDSGSTDITAILADINAVISGEATATDDGGRVKLTLDTGGEDTWIAIMGGDAAAQNALGLAQNLTDFGSTTFVKGQNFHRSVVAYTPVGDEPGEFVSVTDLRIDQSDPTEDDDLIRQPVIYTQGTVNGSDHAPPPLEYLWPGKERLVCSGTTRREQWEVSKLLVPAAPPKFALIGLLGFRGMVRGEIVATAQVGELTIHFTEDEIWAVSGAGPGLNGQGQFFAAQRIPSDTGMSADGWRSLVQTSKGLFFQLDDDKLYLLSGVSLEWVGHAIRERLAEFPVITSAVHSKKMQAVAFGLRNAAGTDGGILRYDLRRGIWFFDDVGEVDALAEYDGRLVYLQDGVAQLQDDSPGSGAFVAYHVDTGMFQGFQSLGYGQLTSVGVLGTYRGDCTLTVSIDYDDGNGFQSLGSFELTSADYADGDAVSLCFQPARQMVDRFRLRYAVTHDSSDSEGLWLHAATLDHTKSPGGSRRPQRDSA